MRGDYEEMNPDDSQPFDWSWLLIGFLAIVLALGAFFAGRTADAAEPPQVMLEPPQVMLAVRAEPVGDVTIPVGPSVTTAWYADRVEVYGYRGGVRYGFILPADASQDAIDRATADLFALLKQPAAGVPVPARPFVPAPTGASTAHTTAPSAGVRNTSSPAPDRGRGRTGTFVLPGIAGGTRAGCTSLG